jgi:hypothetical protein
MTTYRFVAAINPYANVEGSFPGTWNPKDIAVSEDGLTWTTITRNTNIVNNTGGQLAFDNISFANGLWFGRIYVGPGTGAFGNSLPGGGSKKSIDNIQVYYSTNLLDWFATNTTDSLKDIIFNEELGIYISGRDPEGNASATGLAISSTGVDGWSRTSNDSQRSRYYLAKGNGLVGYMRLAGFTIYGVSGSGSTTGINASGLLYSNSALLYSYSANAWLVRGNTGVSVSFDVGATWTVQNPFLNLPSGSGLISGAVFADGRFVIGYREAIATTPVTYSNRIAYSADGLTWNTESVPIIPTYITTARIPNGSDVILISDTAGNTRYKTTLGPGSGWFTSIMPSGLIASGNAMTHVYSNYPDPSQPFFVLGANVPEYTTEQYTVIEATLRYEPPLTTGQENLTLYKVAKDYRLAKSGEVFPAMPQTDEGRPFYTNVYDPDGSPSNTFSTQPGTLRYRYELVEEWGKIAIFINGVDVSFFRDAATIIESISWQTFGNFEAAAFYFSQISQYDKLAESTPTLSSGTGGGILPNAIPWLTDDASIEIKRILPGTTDLETIWIGSVNGLELDESGMGLRITAHGLLYEANHQLLPGSFKDDQTITPRDTGIIAAEILNKVNGRWSYAAPVNTGITTIKSPNWDVAIDFLRNLNSIGSPEIWIDTDYKPYVNGRPDINEDRRLSTFDMIAGQDGLSLSLEYDSTAAPTVIYGTGSLPSGTTWRNVIYPAAPVRSYVSRFPLDNQNDKLSVGMSNADTVTRNGVRVLWEILRNNGYLPVEVGFSRYYSNIVAAAVRNAQEEYGLDVTGEADFVLWSRLVGVGDITDGAYIAPLYTSPLIDPTSPSYDPTVRRIEQFIDFGSNIYPDDAKVVAQRIVERDMIQYNTGTIDEDTIWKQRKSVTGNISMTMDPIEMVAGGAEVSRWDMKPGDSIRIIPHIFAPIQDDKHDAEAGTRWEAGDTAGSLLLFIKRIEWSFNGVPTANLVVSTRNLEYNELDAAQSRVKISNAERPLDQKAKKGSAKGVGNNLVGETGL